MDAERLIDDAARTARRYLYAIAHNTGVPPADVEDVVQEALVRAWQSRDRLDKPDAFLSWLGRICQCRSIDAVHKAARHPSLTLDCTRNLTAPCDPDSDALIADVRRAVDGLREDRRAVVLLWLDGWEIREIGDLLGLGRRAVEWRLKRALVDLARALWMYE
jgi:RNA polymerase sigma-70 factor, ECF subfamily